METIRVPYWCNPQAACLPLVMAGPHIVSTNLLRSWLIELHFLAQAVAACALDPATSESDLHSQLPTQGVLCYIIPCPWFSSLLPNWYICSPLNKQTPNILQGSNSGKCFSICLKLSSCLTAFLNLSQSGGKMSFLLKKRVSLVKIVSETM